MVPLMKMKEHGSVHICMCVCVCVYWEEEMRRVRVEKFWQ